MDNNNAVAIIVKYLLVSHDWSKEANQLKQKVQQTLLTPKTEQKKLNGHIWFLANITSVL